MIDKTLERYKRDIAIAKQLNEYKYADHEYYESVISKFEKLLKFYEDLKLWDSNRREYISA